MNRLLKEDDEEHFNIKETETIDKGQNVLLDESLHIISDYTSLEQNILKDQEECDECHDF